LLRMRRLHVFRNRMSRENVHCDPMRPIYEASSNNADVRLLRQSIHESLPLLSLHSSSGQRCISYLLANSEFLSTIVGYNKLG
ncbi:hypothetical protein PMAYCL1PPCAC_19861, partial [Pristionchus mayeri]